MEIGSDVSRELRLAELKKESLKRSCELAHAHASSVMVFTVRWKELEDHLDMIMKSLVKKENDIDLRQKLLDERETVVELKERELISVRTRIEECNGELDRKIRELDIVQNRTKKCKVEVEGKETKLVSVQTRIDECDDELDSKIEELGWVRDNIDELKVELEEKETELVSVRTRIDECSEELKSKIKELGWVRSSIEECKVEIENKETELGGVRSSIKKCKVELEGKETELGLVQSRIEECSCEYETRKGELDVVIKSVLYWTKNLSLKKEELSSVEDLIEKNLGEIKELELRKSELCEIENMIEVRKEIEEKCKEAEMQEKQITSFVKIEQSESLEEFDPLCPDLQSCILGNGRILQFLMNEHRKKHDLFLDAISNALKRACDPAKLVLDAMHGFYPTRSQKKSIDYDMIVIRRSCILLLEHLLSFSPQITPQVRDEALKLAGRWKAKMRVAVDESLEELGFLHLVAAFGLASDFDGSELHKLLEIADPHYQPSDFSRALGITDELPVIPSQIKTAQSEHIPVSKTVDPTSTDHLLISMAIEGSHDLIPGEVAVALSDSSKFVLHLIQELYSDNRKEGGTDIEEGVMRNYIFLLVRLKEFMQKIDPRVKAQAMKQAAEWKCKMRAVAKNSLEVLCFLEFLLTYELVTSFDREEILNLLCTVAHLKQAPEICRALGFTDMVPDFVQKLIRRNQHLEAIRFIYAFKLIDDISPVSVITLYLDNVQHSIWNISKEGINYLDKKDKSMNLKIDSLRALIQCIEDCKLESAIGAQNQNIQACIAMLQHEKAKWDQYLSIFHPTTPPISGPMFQLRLVENYPSSSGASDLGNIQNFLVMLSKENVQWNHYAPSHSDFGVFSSTPANRQASVPMFHQQQGEQNSPKRPRTDP